MQPQNSTHRSFNASFLSMRSASAREASKAALLSWELFAGITGALVFSSRAVSLKMAAQTAVDNCDMSNILGTMKCVEFNKDRTPPTTGSSILTGVCGCRMRTINISAICLTTSSAETGLRKSNTFAAARWCATMSATTVLDRRPL